MNTSRNPAMFLHLLEPVEASTRFIMMIGGIYRLAKDSQGEEHRFIMETSINGQWVNVKQWDDPGAVASMIVRHGLAADHSAALQILQG